MVSQDLLAYAAALELEDIGRVVLRFDRKNRPTGKPRVNGENDDQGPEPALEGAS
jgi:hypothetical protein